MNKQTEFLIRSLEEISGVLASHQLILEDACKFYDSKEIVISEISQMRLHLISKINMDNITEIIDLLNCLDEVESLIGRTYAPFSNEIANAGMLINNLRNVNTSLESESNISLHIKAIRLIEELTNDLNDADSLNAELNHRILLKSIERAKMRVYAL